MNCASYSIWRLSYTFVEKSEKENLKREQKQVFKSILCVPFSLFNVYFVHEMSSLKMKWLV